MRRPRNPIQSPERCAVIVRRRPGAPPLRGAGPRLLTFALPALFTLLALAGCSQPSIPAEWTVELSETLTIGANPESHETALYMPLAIGFDFKNRIFVLDSGNHRIQIFGPDGQFERSLGSYGAAPGNLSSPMGMWVYPDGSLIVADARNRRLQPYGASGAVLDTIPLDFAPLDVVGTKDRLFVQRLAQASMIMGPDKRALVQVLDRTGAPVDAFVDATEAQAGVLYLLRNTFCMASGPAGRLALSDTHFASRIRLFSPAGALQREIAVLYKAGAWAPLGRQPRTLNDESLKTIAKTASDLTWDPLRNVYWLLAGYSDQDPDGEWIIGQELYRYDADGNYRGSAMLPMRATVLAAAPDGMIWIADIEGVLHGFTVRDPDMESLIPATFALW